MIGFSRNKNANKAPHRGAGALFAASSVLTLVNANAALESVGNTTMDTIRYGASALLLGTTAVVSFLKFGRNFEATMPLPLEVEAAKAPKRPLPGRGAGPLFVASSIVAAANATATETLSSVSLDALRNGASALVLAGIAAASLVKRLKQPVHEFAKVGAPVDEFPSIEDERMADRRMPVIKGGAAEFTITELLEQATARARAEEDAGLQAAFNGTSHPIS